MIQKKEFLLLEHFPVDHGLDKQKRTSAIFCYNISRPRYDFYSYLHTSKKGAKWGFSLLIFLYNVQSPLKKDVLSPISVLFIYQQQMS